jgi:hypothetical protein
MEHILRVLVRIDTNRSSACIELRGCLVPENCPDLLDILQHTATLGAHVVINLTKATHLEATPWMNCCCGQTRCRPAPWRAGTPPSRFNFLHACRPASLPGFRGQAFP